jgi:transcriptional regulator with XRE-family HTH domain
MLSVVKTVERDRARELRLRDGRSIKEIAGMLNVSVSSVSLWVRDIELTPEQHDALRQRNPAYNQLLSGRAVAAANRRRERTEAQREGRVLARRRDPLHIAGCMLYWAEGSKARNQLRFANSDPQMVRFFVGFLRKYFDLSDDAIRISCHLFADHVERQREVERFWLDTLGLTEASLRKSIVNVYSRHSKRKRLNMLPHGTCHVVVSRTSVTQHIFGAIQEYGGFDRPEWLD